MPHVLGPQDVKLLVLTAFHGPPETVWYPDGRDFAHGRTVSIPATGTTTVNVPFD